MHRYKTSEFFYKSNIISSIVVVFHNVKLRANSNTSICLDFRQIFGIETE